MGECSPLTHPAGELAPTLVGDPVVLAWRPVLRGPGQGLHQPTSLQPAEKGVDAPFPYQYQASSGAIAP